MKKTNYIILIMTVIGGMMFSLGMCMTLLPEWNMMKPGIVLGALGIIILLAAMITYRKTNGIAPVKIDLKTIAIILYGIFATLVFGVGISTVLVNTQWMIQGIVIGMAGIVLLLGLIPMIKGLH